MSSQLENPFVAERTAVAGRAPSSVRPKLAAIGAIAAFAILLGVGAVPRIARQKAAASTAAESSITHPVVSIIHPTKGEPVSQLLLPGNIEPLYSASVYARVDGYVERRNVDIGSHVRAGQVLAVISSPEIDQQLLQARATLAQSQAALQQALAALEQSKANAELARLTKDRDIPLAEQHALSQQIVDEAVQAHNARVADVTASKANIAAAEANVTANRANVARLEQMQGFEKVLAPFDGVITERNVERGDLVNAGSAPTAKSLVSIAQSGTLRIQVDVPQSQAINIRDGQLASVTVNERQGRVYSGTVVRSASSLDSAARTMRTEVQLENRDGSLLPGMYAQIKFTLAEQRPVLVIPTSSLIIDQAGMHVVTVAKNIVHFVPVTIGKDMGTHIEILSGLTESDSLVSSPSDLLNENSRVEVR